MRPWDRTIMMIALLIFGLAVVQLLHFTRMDPYRNSVYRVP